MSRPTRQGQRRADHMTQRFHRQRVEIAEYDAHAEKARQQPCHEQPERRHAAGDPRQGMKAADNAVTPISARQVRKRMPKRITILELSSTATPMASAAMPK